mgnify:CR=1 FL=1
MNIDTQDLSFYDLIEQPFDGCERVAALWEWSTNCDQPTPASFFLDLVGVSEDIFGEKMVGEIPQMGYVELDLLGKALVEYSDRPDIVRHYCQRLVEAELEGEHL